MATEGKGQTRIWALPVTLGHDCETAGDLLSNPLQRVIFLTAVKRTLLE